MVLPAWEICLLCRGPERDRAAGPIYVARSLDRAADGAAARMLKSAAGDSQH
jgi:hypothetical protein